MTQFYNFGSYETLRIAVFLGVLIALVLAEALWPWRGRADRLARWPSNIGIVVVDALLVRLLFPVTVAGLALVAGAQGIGLLRWLSVPLWLAVPLAVVLLDLVIYGQHVVFHKVPALWRLHRMHHADTVLDVSTGLRFHPVEILLSVLIKMAAVVALGAPAEAVLLFEILLNATSMFNHADIRLSSRLDRILRHFLVTPDMHRIHHSVIRAETDSNYGFSLPWWDRLFGTYRNEPQAGRDGIEIGLNAFRDPAERRLDRMLTQPFRRADRDN